MRSTIIRISRYANDNIENAIGNLKNIKELQSEIISANQNLVRMKRYEMLHNKVNTDISYKIFLTESDIKEKEQMLEKVKSSLINNICFVLSYASEIFSLGMTDDSSEFDIISGRLLRKIFSIIDEIDIQSNVPLYALIPKLVEVEIKILLSENRSRYMPFRMLIRDIKSKIE